MKPILKTCDHCQVSFMARYQWGSKAHQRFCSRKCYDDSGDRRYTPEEAVAAFWAMVDKGPHPKGCWLYMGFRKWDGYGWLSRLGRYMTAHRYAWILTHGEPPKGAHILHQCDNAPCCNPAHLRLGTHAENMAEMKARGRSNGGHHTKRRPVLFPDRVRPRRQA
jgi:hypothetical protein